MTSPVPGRPSPRQHDVDHSKDIPNEAASISAPKPRSRIFTKAKELWLAKTGIDTRTAMQLFKGAIAPTIATTCYQATSYADTFTTLGYLVGIMAILSLPIQPRAKFLQTMLVNLLSTSLGAALSLLAGYCAVRARINTEGITKSGGTGTSGMAAAGAATTTYNSSASAVAALWLIVWIYAISVVRAKCPQFTIPCIMNAIFANVSMIYIPQFATTGQLQAFVRRLLEAFLTGFAISTAVSLWIFPLTSRQVVFKEMAGYIQSLRAVIQANLEYCRSLEEMDPFAPHRINTAGEEEARNKEADIFKAKMQELLGLHAKLNTDLPFAKREVALGRLGPDDLQEVFRHLRFIMLPTVGLSSTQEVFQRIAEQKGWDTSQDFSHKTVEDAVTEEEKIRAQTVLEWHELMRRLREPFGSVTQLIDDGLQHAAVLLQLAPLPQKDPEYDGEEPRPGDRNFSEFYNARSQGFLESKKEMLRAWCSLHNIQLPANFFDDPENKDFQAPDWMNHDIESPFRKGFQASGKLSKTRLVVPGLKRLQKWFFTILMQSGESHDDQQIDSGENTTTVYLGDAYKQRKDPDHLPAANAWEKLSDNLRKISHFLASPASSFGFRVSCATMSIAVVAYLHDTQTFYTTQRLFWSQIMISISMSPSAGQSIRNFLLRVFGTFVAMLLAWIAWYIVDGKTAGVLVFYFFFLHFGVWIVLKRPSIIPVGMISQVTLTLILGYELQVRKIGIATATSNGQAYYPVYELGPIRLATVAGGLFLAWIWTIFPYPTTEHFQLRQNVGRTLYLLANYYSVMHETVRIRLRGLDEDISSKHSPIHKLDKARRKLFTKSSILLAGLRAQAEFVKFDVPIGGRFPREKYQEIIRLLQSTLNFMSLVSLASADFEDLHQMDRTDKEHSSRWLRDFRNIVSEAHITSEQVTTLLSLLSSSVMNGQPVPPYLHVPEPFQLAQRMDQIDQDILSVRHIAEPGYAAFAVMQIGTRCVIDDLGKILAAVQELVGVLDFSYHVVSTQDASRDESEVTVTMSRQEFTTSALARNKQD
ncbi:Aromatic acid exporter family member 2 [Teratosphaeria destructans]|uniref:Aromatic acid exporter family member 2 n=1 Tax=Teratosphaeria destructans TaxID=418781 RepID=A0A9W7SZ99_9PEZI|nr:Aromatic acid exporter family member 2 [Teratosphaeria destructans]